MDELISVIIPIYNVEKYLVQCLDSVIEQTYKNLEIILVDDGSPDNCGGICDQYALKDHRIKVIHQENRGLSEARNSGMDIMTGSYFAFVDSDDVINSRFIEVLYNLLKQHNTDISMCEFYIFNDNEQIENMIPEQSVNIAVMSKEEYANGLLGYYTFHLSAVWNKLYKSSKYGNIRFHKGLRFEDSLFLADYLAIGASCVCTTAKLYNYRKRPNSLTSKKDLNYILESIRASEYQYNTLKDCYGSKYKLKFYIGLLNRISRLAADAYWNLSKKDSHQIYTVWRKFYDSDRQYIPNLKENAKILIYKYFPTLYYRIVKKSLYSLLGDNY